MFHVFSFMFPICFQMICQKLCQNSVSGWESKAISIFDKMKLLCWHIGNDAQTRLSYRTCCKCHGRGTATQKQRQKWWGLGSQKVVVCCVCVASMTGKWFFSSMTLQPSLFFNELQSKGNLGLFMLIFTFQSTSNVFQSWSERVRKSFLPENRGSSVISIRLHSSPDCQDEFDMKPLYPEGPS